MLAIVPIVFALQLSSGHDAAGHRAALRIDHGAASVTRGSLWVSSARARTALAATETLEKDATLRLIAPGKRTESEPVPLPTYYPAPEEWIAHFAGHMDLADASVTHAARWVAAFPLKVYVGSGAVSMRFTVRTP